jgi:ferritin
MELKSPITSKGRKPINGYNGGLPVEMINIINAGIESEAFSSQIYLQMGIWCDVKGFTGAAKFFRKHSEEERKHMLHLYDFLADKNIVAITPVIESPQTEYKGLMDVLYTALEHEFFVTSFYEDAAQKALKLPCHQSYQLFQFFIKEQVEEESLYQTIVDKAEILSIGGLTGVALMELDEILDDLV